LAIFREDEEDGAEKPLPASSAQRRWPDSRAQKQGDRIHFAGSRTIESEPGASLPSGEAASETTHVRSAAPAQRPDDSKWNLSNFRRYRPWDRHAYHREYQARRHCYAARKPLEPRVYPTHNTLSENIRTQSVGLLNRHLAAAIDLPAQMKQAHRNVRGPGFIAIHTLFDEVAGYADLLAERAGGLGGAAEGTVQNAAECTFLIRYPFGVAKEEEHVFAVSGALAAFGESTHEAITQAATYGDAETADLFTEISRGVDQQLWLVESRAAPQ
jgi:starvation-inducible DNA-binding protein